MSYRDEDTVRVIVTAHDLMQPLTVAHSHDADVVVEAERLDQSEVDLQSYVPLKLLVHGQDAEGDTVGVSVDQRDTVTNKILTQSV